MNQKLLERFRYTAPQPQTPALPSEAENGASDRRNFLKKTALGGLSLGLMFHQNAAAETEYVSQKVNRASKPSDLKITDMSTLR